MTWASTGRVASVAVVGAVCLLALSGSQADRTDGQLATVAARTPLGVDSFRSVRRYQHVAEPVRLRIPAIGVDTPLQRLGRAPDGSLEVPTDFGLAGWFADGPRPGQLGPAVLLGHVDSETVPGVFYRLAGLARDAEVLVERADGSTAEFRVRGSLRVPKDAFPTDLVYGPTLQASLRLVTCGGSFDHATESYRDNVVVYAEPV